jgi:hypothetical protein
MTNPDSDNGNSGRFPDGSPVTVKYLLTREQECGGRAAWPWLPGWIVAQCGPDEWQVAVGDRRVAAAEDGTRPAPDTPDDDLWFPTCYRDASELRPASPTLDEMRAIFPESGDEPGPHEPRRAGTSPMCTVCGREHVR